MQFSETTKSVVLAYSLLNCRQEQEKKTKRLKLSADAGSSSSLACPFSSESLFSRPRTFKDFTCSFAVLVAGRPCSTGHLGGIEEVPEQQQQPKTKLKFEVPLKWEEDHQPQQCQQIDVSRP